MVMVQSGHSREVALVVRTDRVRRRTDLEVRVQTATAAATAAVRVGRVGREAVGGVDRVAVASEPAD